MEVTFGGLPKAEVILLVLMLVQLVFLWGSVMYKMGTKDEK
ncbi:MAG: hypothetical protein ACP5G3_04210 [Sulfurihydrogenibium sp.]